MVFLVVDDDTATLTAIHRMLRVVVPPGWSIVTTSDPILGRSLLTLDPKVKIAIVDYLMPELNGLALIEEALHYRPELRGKIIVVSGVTWSRDVAHKLFNVLGCRRLDKPVDLNELEKLVWTIMLEGS